MTPSRRSFLTGLGASLIAAPAVVRFASLMPVRGIVQAVEPNLVGLYSELCHYTRKAFVPRLFVQIYEPTPLFQMLAEMEQER